MAGTREEMQEVQTFDMTQWTNEGGMKDEVASVAATGEAGLAAMTEEEGLAVVTEEAALAVETGEEHLVEMIEEEAPAVVASIKSVVVTREERSAAASEDQTLRGDGERLLRIRAAGTMGICSQTTH